MAGRGPARPAVAGRLNLPRCSPRRSRQRLARLRARREPHLGGVRGGARGAGGRRGGGGFSWGWRRSRGRRSRSCRSERGSWGGTKGASSSCGSLLAGRAATGRLEILTVDAVDTEATLGVLESVDLVWLETLTNPMLEVPELDCDRRRGSAARRHLDRRRHPGDPDAPAPTRAGRRPRGPQRDQVHRRPLRPVLGVAATRDRSRAERTGAPGREPRSAPSPARWRSSLRCGDFARCP